MSFADNIKAREEAEKFITEEIIPFLELAGEHTPRFWEIVSNELVKLVRAKLPSLVEPIPVDKYPAFTEQQARAFERETVPYGKFKGKYVGEVPPDYLLFLTEGDEFSKQLRRYVKTKTFYERQE